MQVHEANVVRAIARMAVIPIAPDSWNVMLRSCGIAALAALVVASARSVDIGQSHQNSLDMPAAGTKRHANPAFYVPAQGLCNGEMPCLNFNLHGYLRGTPCLWTTTDRLMPVEKKKSRISLHQYSKNTKY